MSGPKVVRIVTREEIIAICTGLLAALDKAVQGWSNFCSRNELATRDEIEATIARRDQLAELLKTERFLDLQKRVPEEMEFLRADQQSRTETAVLKKATALANKRRAQAGAGALLAALKQNGKSVPGDLQNALEEIAQGRSDDTSAFSSAFALLSREEPAGLTQRQQELIDAYKSDESPESLNEWLIKTSADDELTPLEQRISELTIYLGEGPASEFRDRLDSISNQAPSRSRSLLLDSLQLDLSQAVSSAKKLKDVEHRLRLLSAQLASNDSESAKTWAQNIQAKLGGPIEVLLELEAKAKEVLDVTIKQVAARSSRKAVLEGLAELGYATSEGMETAWVTDGRIVLKRTLDSGYGVEVTGNVDTGRVQMRTVAFRRAGSVADRSSDIAAEKTFCNDVSRLQEEFADDGGTLLIERSTAIGVTPLKSIDFEVDQDETREGVSRTIQQRTIK